MQNDDQHTRFMQTQQDTQADKDHDTVTSGRGPTREDQLPWVKEPQTKPGEENLTVHPGGAHRVETGIPPFSDMPWDVIYELCRLVYAEGRQKYDKEHVSGTAFNWQRGLDPESTFNHMMNHLLLYKSGDRSEPHLLKVVWGCLTQYWYDMRLER